MAVEHFSCERRKARAKEKWRFLGCQLSIFNTPRSGEPQRLEALSFVSRQYDLAAGGRLRVL
jgi:hypothetical protein